MRSAEVEPGRLLEAFGEGGELRSAEVEPGRLLEAFGEAIYQKDRSLSYFDFIVKRNMRAFRFAKQEACTHNETAVAFVLPVKSAAAIWALIEIRCFCPFADTVPPESPCVRGRGHSIVIRTDDPLAGFQGALYPFRDC